MIDGLKQFPEISQNVFDFRAIKDLGILVTTLGEIIRTENLLMHGSPTQQNILEPRQANDLDRESGNRLAIYATDNPERAIFHAILNAEYLKTKFNSFVTGYSSAEDGSLEFKVTENIMGLVEEGDVEIFCDGYIYLLTRESFTLSEGDASEYQSNEAVTPLVRLIISRDIGSDIRKRTSIYQ